MALKHRGVKLCSVLGKRQVSRGGVATFHRTIAGASDHSVGGARSLAPSHRSQNHLVQ